ncbi:MAG: DUF4384 domain-containing protein [Firmicutes bacterium]|nr:DUF4384 domain-containing protein [Bacillota bacterium]
MGNARVFRGAVLGLVLCAVLALSAVGLADEPKAKLFINPTPDPGFSVQMWVDRGQGATYYPGDNIRISFRSTRSCYVYLLDIDTSGNYKWLLPSTWWGNNYLPANQARTLPEGRYNLQVEGPPGTEWLILFASTQPLDMPYLEQSIRSGQFAPRIQGQAEIITKNIRAKIQVIPATAWVSTSTYFYVGGPPQAGPIVPPPLPPPPVESAAVSIWSSPSGALVFIDGEQMGYTPTTFRNIPLGNHEITLIKQGYYTYTRRMSITYPGTFYISANMQRID